MDVSSAVGKSIAARQLVIAICYSAQKVLDFIDAFIAKRDFTRMRCTSKFYASVTRESEHRQFESISRPIQVPVQVKFVVELLLSVDRKSRRILLRLELRGSQT